MRILAIETSCDETSVAIYDQYKGLLINKTYSQIKLHANYGGIVPELASRKHMIKIVPLIKLSLNKINLNFSDINCIVYTAGPGLVGSLIVGATIATSLAYSLKIPVIGINHMEGHCLSPMLEKKSPKFPFIALLISGGHTQIVLANNIGKYQILSESLDDAVGEVFDKIAKSLGLSYPGGIKLSNLAKNGISGKYIFPKPMINSPGLELSFSGLKTHVINVINLSNNTYQVRANIAKAFEDTIIDILLVKCKKAIKLTGLNRLVISGGVSANFKLRNNFKKMINKINGKIYYPRLKFCTDNAAMIAYVGMLYFKMGINMNLSILVKPNWSLNEICSVYNI